MVPAGVGVDGIVTVYEPKLTGVLVEFEFTTIEPAALPGPDVAVVGVTVPTGVPKVAVPAGVPFGFSPMNWTFTPAADSGAVVMPTPTTVPVAVAAPKPGNVVPVTGAPVRLTPTDGGVVVSEPCVGTKPLGPVEERATPYVTPPEVVVKTAVFWSWFNWPVKVQPAGAVH